MNTVLKILGTGSYLPTKIVSNDDLAVSLDTCDEWIFSHTGIHARHIADVGECTSSMAAEAAQRALSSAQCNKDDIGLVIVATSTPDYNTFPATACIVQQKLGLRNCGAFDLQAACSGFIYALEQARGWVQLHPDRKALVIGAETLSRVVDWNDRASCILFGDGAGAVVIGVSQDVPNGVRSAQTMLGSDGSGCSYIAREGGSRVAPSPGTIPVPRLMLQGRPVFNFAVRTLDMVIMELCVKSGLVPQELAHIFAHQANGRIIEAVARRMALPLERFYMNIQTTGNTSAASVPICLDEAVKKGLLKDGEDICLAGFGSGLTYGGILMSWPYL